MKDLTQSTLTALQAGLTFATTHQLEAEPQLDAETTHPSYDLSEIDFDDLLGQTLSDVLGLSRTAQGEAVPTKVDRLAHEQAQRELWRTYPDAAVVGQMGRGEEWEAARLLRDGGLLFVLDAIDGIKPYHALTFGHGATAMVFQRRRSGFEFLASVVVNSSGLYLTFDFGGDAPTVGSLVPPRSFPLSEPKKKEADLTTVAAVAAAPELRGRARALFESRSLTVFTTGGAPAALGMALGYLGSIVAVDAQRTYDAAALPALRFLGCHVVTQNKTEPTLLEIVRTFEEVASDFSDRHASTFPAFVVSRSAVTANRLAHDLWPHD